MIWKSGFKGDPSLPRDSFWRLGGALFLLSDCSPRLPICTWTEQRSPLIPCPKLLNIWGHPCQKQRRRRSRVLRACLLKASRQFSVPGDELILRAGNRKRGDLFRQTPGTRLLRAVHQSRFWVTLLRRGLCNLQLEKTHTHSSAEPSGRHL